MYVRCRDAERAGQSLTLLSWAPSLTEMDISQINNPMTCVYSGGMLPKETERGQERPQHNSLHPSEREKEKGEETERSREREKGSWEKGGRIEEGWVGERENVAYWNDPSL